MALTVAVTIFTVPVGALATSFSTTSHVGDSVVTTTFSYDGLRKLGLRVDIANKNNTNTFVSTVDMTRDWALNFEADGVPLIVDGILQQRSELRNQSAPGSFGRSETPAPSAWPEPVEILLRDIQHIADELPGFADDLIDDIIDEILGLDPSLGPNSIMGCLACAGSKLMVVAMAVGCVYVAAHSSGAAGPTCAGATATAGLSSDEFCERVECSDPADWECGSSISLDDNGDYFDIEASTGCSKAVTIMQSPIWMNWYVDGELYGAYEVGGGNMCASSTSCQNSWFGVYVPAGCYEANMHHNSTDGRTFEQTKIAYSNRFCIPPPPCCGSSAGTSNVASFTKANSHVRSAS